MGKLLRINTFIYSFIRGSGEGLTNKDILKLFVAFEQLNQVNNIEGTGIGLVISKNLIELMSGYIGVESTVGKDIAFWVDLNFSGLILELLAKLSI